MFCSVALSPMMIVVYKHGSCLNLLAWWVTWYSMVPVLWETVNFFCSSACCVWFWCYQNSALSFHSWSVLTFCYCTVAVFLPSDILVGLLCSLFCSIFFFLNERTLAVGCPDLSVIQWWLLVLFSAYFHKSWFFPFLTTLDCWANVWHVNDSSASWAA